MSTETTLANEWVASYLDALLSSGLSSEHVRSQDQQQQRTTKKGAEDEPQNIAARYYVHQILSLDEDHIRDAWAKANRPSRYGAHQAVRDARMEHLSWRVWTMKRRRAEVQAALEADRREAAADLLRTQGMDEEKVEMEATTRQTIDELNSSTIAAFQECGLADAGAFGSVAFEALPEGLESILMENAAHSQKSDGKDDSSAASSKASAGLPFKQQAAAGKAPILSLAAAKAAAAGAGRGPPSPDSKDSLLGPLPPTPFATGQVSMPQKFTPSAVGAVPPTALAGNATPPSTLAGASSAGNLSGAIQPAQQPAATADPLLVSRFPRLYVILISLHGLVRGEKMELGKDPDTGGQVKYVVELAKSMAQFPSVARVDLLTRLICDPKVDKSYGEAEERLLLPPLPPTAAAVAAHYGGTGDYPPANATAVAADLLAEDGSPKSGNSVVAPASAAPLNSNSSRGAFIVRLQCGDPKVYLRKEDLWPHTREFADRAIAHAQATLQKLQESGEGPCELYVVHGHYADAGEVAAMVSSSLGADCVLTGHSLGRNKKEHLLKSGNMSTAEVEATYRISRRIEAEERALDAASVVFTSTQQEVAEQWGTYDGYSDQLSAALQLRPCKGYHVPRMAVIPPGLDFSNLKVSMPQDPWEEVLGTCALPPALTPAGGSGVAMGMKMNGIHGTPPLSPRNSNLPASSPRISPNNSHQPASLPAPSEVGTIQGTSFNSTVPPAAAESAANISFMVCPNDCRPCHAAGQITSGKEGSSPTAPGTPASVLSSTPLTPTNPGSSAGAVSSDAGDSRDNSKRLGQLKINVPGVMVASEGSHVPANGKHSSNEQKNGNNKAANGLADTEAALLALPEGLDLSTNPGNGTALLKRKSTSGLGGNITPPNSFTGRPSVAGNNGNTGEVVTAPSRRQSHIGAEGNRSVAATPRSPGPHNFAGIHPGKMNPRVLAAMMVGESEPAIWKEINRFLRHPGRPVILAMSRPDAKKNILALVRAYGQNRVLRDLANLVLIMGNRDVIDGMAPGSARVLSDVLKLVDTYDLYGQVAYPKKHSQADISDIYLLAAATRGVFVNIALQEPFGLTLIEAAAHGAPIVATKNGGPVDIVRTLKNGVLVEPTDTNAIAEACVSLITSQRTWEEYSDNGRNNITAYSWPSHCARYLRTVQDQKASNPNRMPQYVGGGQDTHAQAAPPRIRHTLSLSYDDLSSMARAIASTPAGGDALGNANKQGPSSDAARKPSGEKDESSGQSPVVNSSSAPWLEDLEHSRPQHQTQPAGLRTGSMPPQSTGAGMGHMMHARGNGTRGQKPVLAGGEAEKSEGDSAFQTASMAVVEEQDNEAEVAPTPGTLSKAGSGVPPLSTHPVYLQPRLTQHEQFVVFNIDTLADVRSCAPLIRALVGGGLSTTMADGGSSGWSETDLQACMGELLRDRNGGRPLGVGVLCTWSAKDMRALLSKEGVNPLSLDFMVCNAGALIWHAMASDAHQAAPASAPADDSSTTQITTQQQQDAAAKAGSESTAGTTAPVEASSGSGSMMQRAGSLGLSLLGMNRAGSGENAESAGKDVTLGSGWMCDDQWERHVDFRWDDRVVLQVLRRILDNKTGWGKLHIVRPTPTPTPAGTTAVHLRMSPKCTPYHYMVDVDVAGSVGGRAPLPPNEVAQQLLAAVRRKLRMCGVRAQLTITPREALPSSNDASSRRARGLSAIAGNILNSLLSRTASNAAAVAPDGSPNSMTLHITPLRCTRPLALRHLATKFKKPLDAAWTLVACTTSDGTPASVVLSTTDGEDLLGGVQKVTLIPTSQPGGLGFPVDVSVFGTVTTTQPESEKAAARLRLFATSSA